MATLREGLRIQARVVTALAIRELTTRFGRENIGFLWLMAEPLMFAIFVGLIWRVMKGPDDHGIGIIAFVATGYIPLVFFRNSVSRCVGLFRANGSLMYHRQIKVIDFVFVRCMVEMIGHAMAYVFMMLLLIPLGLLEIPHDFGCLLSGWLLYSLFTFSVCTIVAPLAETSDVVEKLLPVTTYLMIPFSGTFTLQSWLTPQAQKVLLWSPAVNAMEIMRFGVFGNEVEPFYVVGRPIMISMAILLLGLGLCRRVRRQMIVE